MSEDAVPVEPKDQPKADAPLDKRLIRVGAIDQQQAEIEKTIRALQGRKRTMAHQKIDLVNNIIKEDGVLGTVFWKSNNGEEGFTLVAQAPCERLFNLIDHKPDSTHRRKINFGGGEDEDPSSMHVIINKTDITLSFDSVNDMINFCLEYGIHADIRPMFAYRDELASELLELDDMMNQFVESHGVEIETAPEIKEALQAALEEATEATAAKKAEEEAARRAKEEKLNLVKAQAANARAAKAAQAVTVLSGESESQESTKEEANNNG